MHDRASNIDPPTIDPSAAIRHQRREVRGVGLRYVAQQTARLADADPGNYAAVSHGTLSRIERSAGDWFTTTLDIRVVQALVVVLWGGDYAAFVRDTGIRLPLPLYTQREPIPESINAPVPYHLEGERPSLAQRHRRLIEPAFPGVDFVLGAVGHDMAPMVDAGQVVACVRDTDPQEGQMAVLLRSAGLQLAWALGRAEYATERSTHPFALADGESVYGVVAYLEPRDPNIRARLNHPTRTGRPDPTAATHLPS